ncbi:MAG: peptidase S8 [Bacteroidetes bacterium]|nr:MAG: peptidase S8 [Bacteroidota bacterium]
MNTKRLVASLLACSALLTFAQPPQNWHHLSPEKNTWAGIATEEAYELLKGKTAQPVIVAVIDDGTDYLHEDLAGNIWVNEDEIPGNGLDDDKNGYIDDIHGWNFIGTVQYDNLELTRLYRSMRILYEHADPSRLSVEEKKKYDYYQEIRHAFEEKRDEERTNAAQMGVIVGFVKKVKASNNGIFDKKTLKAYVPDSDNDIRLQKRLLTLMKLGLLPEDFGDQVGEIEEEINASVNYHINLSYDSRHLVGDNYDDVQEKGYGNADVLGPNGRHGTHVAGIIGALRGNGIGIDGVAAPVRIMVLRVVPNGDERDKDVANALRYAADNGAKVVNMSFGKYWSLNKTIVDEAARYAASKDVLLVQGAGNDSRNLDLYPGFPNDTYEDGSVANHWLVVGASSWEKGPKRIANFSNYGKREVDLFAPGVAIYSTVKSSKYQNLDGTSMASPVAAGVAALIRAYFPDLSAPEVKQLLMASVVPVKGKVVVPGGAGKDAVSNLCASGGLLNARKAVELALAK